MSRADRREHLLAVAHDLYSKAKSQADFTIGMIAARGEVSEIWVRKIIGAEYQELRTKLKGSQRSPKTVQAKLRQKIRIQQNRIKELEAIIEANDQGDFAGMVRQLEMMDAEYRRWRELAELYEKRQKQAEVVMEIKAS